MKAIAKKKAEAAARAFLGDPEITDPFDALLGEVHEAAGNVAFLRQLVQQLDVHPSVEISTDPDENPLTVKKGIYGPDMNGYESPHVLVKMYNEERDRLTRSSKMAIDCGIAERQVKVAERQAEIIASIILALCADPRLGLTQEKQIEARRIAGELMRRTVIEDVE